MVAENNSPAKSKSGSNNKTTNNTATAKSTPTTKSTIIQKTNQDLTPKIGSIFLEVKSPIGMLQVGTYPKHVTLHKEFDQNIVPKPSKKPKPVMLAPRDRLLRHMSSLAGAMRTEYQTLIDSIDPSASPSSTKTTIVPPRAVILTCFMYDNPGFQVPTLSFCHPPNTPLNFPFTPPKLSPDERDAIGAQFDHHILQGLELWQANFVIEPQTVTLSKFFRLSYQASTPTIATTSSMGPTIDAHSQEQKKPKVRKLVKA